MSAPAPIRAADALRTLAQLLGIDEDAIGADTVATFERDASAALGLTQALRFFSDPYAADLVRAFLDVEDPAGRRAIANTCCAIAGSFNVQKAVRS
ncbi:hypothetical protein [Methylorubrum sp. POS3]|uniref:hypothetical protein n=1 Tax=Methylorubrum sp. POS3 TaxID=2998492 RepID=UPI00372C8C4D